ncbi:hypothetical protein [Sphingosinicella sp. BN140058]|uniref:hypothetical protein n=1 Tax=Sphingosinicella sp. BN140058 TaxID=1892855 RepID=UPI001011D2BD|nr:hypothetical protein [Sphingosinicella sp. BN140058]QAY80340.1 hypothetical protein ETR14_27235 [Sphingosinicella sp. BN140058]
MPIDNDSRLPPRIEPARAALAGAIVEQDFSGADARIEISSVPEEQPLRTAGIWTIVDQYDDRHLVELNCDTWVAVNPAGVASF